MKVTRIIVCAVVGLLLIGAGVYGYKSLRTRIEEKQWLAQRMPAWVTSDMLTLVGFLGSLVMATGYCLSNLNLNWLWLSCLGLFINWFGDSLDGSLARVRNTQRKTYGFSSTITLISSTKPSCSSA